ncbi:MAG: hypothetical protein RBT69_11465 [Spirochaetia bacterium]|nr:hypothetical protein [Spirochaetia bacterium]
MTPVTDRISLESIPPDWNARKAGLSAMSVFTMISPPSIPVFAVSSSEWKMLKAHNTVKEIPFPEAGGCEIEIWSYKPDTFILNDAVDPLSLSLIFQDTDDERIESALEEIKGVFPW